MATGDMIAVLTPGMIETPLSNSAVWDTKSTHEVLNFGAAAANHIAVFSVYMPDYYSGNGMAVRVIGCAKTGTTGDVDLDFEVERKGIVQDIDTDTWGTKVSVVDQAVPSSVQRAFVITASLTTSGQMDSVAAGEWFLFRVTRPNTDTLSGDYQIKFIRLQEA